MASGREGSSSEATEVFAQGPQAEALTAPEVEVPNNDRVEQSVEHVISLVEEHTTQIGRIDAEVKQIYEEKDARFDELQEQKQTIATLQDQISKLERSNADQAAMITLLVNGDIPVKKSESAPAEKAKESQPDDEDTRDLDRYMQRFESHHQEDEQPAEGRDFEEATPQPVVETAPQPAAEAAPEGPVYSTYDKDAIEDAEVEEADPEGQPPEDVEPQVPTQPEVGQDLIVVPGVSGGENSEPQGPEANKPGTDLIVPPSTELVPFNPEAPNFAAELQAASDRYAELSAKTRNGYAGRLLRSSRFLVKIPGLRWLAERANASQNQELDAAKADYEEALKQSQLAIVQELREQNPDAGPELAKIIQLNTADCLSRADAAFEDKLTAERKAASKKTNKFVNWWVRQDGLGDGFLKRQLSKAKKAGVIFGAGAGVGSLVGGVGVAVGATTLLGGMLLPGVGAVAGAAASLAIAKHVTKRRANGLNKEGITLAEAQSKEDRALKQQAIDARKNESVYVADPNHDPASDAQPKYVDNKEAIAQATDLTDTTESRTNQELARNRARLKAAGSIGAAGGLAGVNIAEGIAQALTPDAAEPTKMASRPDVPEFQPPADVPPEVPATPDVPAAPEVVPGSNVYVEPGSGLIREVGQWAEGAGHNISGGQAESLYNALNERFGADNLIDMLGTNPDTYVRAVGDTGIIAPGDGVWRTGVEEFMNNWLTSQGL